MNQRRKASLPAESLEIPRFYGGGIRNGGNTCYMNAVLQLLLRFRPMHDLMRSCKRQTQFTNTIDLLIQEIQRATTPLEFPQALSEAFVNEDPGRRGPGDAIDFLHWFMYQLFDHCDPEQVTSYVGTWKLGLGNVVQHLVWNFLNANERFVTESSEKAGDYIT